MLKKDMKTKICNRCKKEKDIEQFTVYYENSYGYKERLSYCKECEPKKVCWKCKEGKSIYDFYKTNRYRDGRTAWCKKCIDDYYKENPDEKKEINRLNSKAYYEKVIKPEKEEYKKFKTKWEITFKELYENNNFKLNRKVIKKDYQDYCSLKWKYPRDKEKQYNRFVKDKLYKIKRRLKRKKR